MNSIDLPLNDVALSYFLGTFAATLLFVLVAGILLGLKRHVVVFRNFDDVALVFFTKLSFIGLIIAGTMTVGAIGFSILFFLLLVIWLGFMYYIVKRTHSDNGDDVGATVVALITKLFLSWLLIFSIVNIFNPGGSTGRQRSQTRGISALILLVLLPLITALVRDPLSGIYSPRWLKRTMFLRRGIP